jgi:hypothetical protein
VKIIEFVYLEKEVSFDSYKLRADLTWRKWFKLLLRKTEVEHRGFVVGKVDILRGFHGVIGPVLTYYIPAF